MFQLYQVDGLDHSRMRKLLGVEENSSKDFIDFIGCTGCIWGMVWTWIHGTPLVLICYNNDVLTSICVDSLTSEPSHQVVLGKKELSFLWRLAQYLTNITSFYYLN